MYTYKDRIKAVKLLIKYDMSYSDVTRVLGYPSRRALRNWYKEYSKDGCLHQKFAKKSKYLKREKEIAVNYYLEHGKNISRTVKKLGYPCRPTLNSWILELAPKEKKYCIAGGANIEFSQEEKTQAVISLCSRTNPAREIATRHNSSRESLYRWKKQLLGKEYVYSMKKNKKEKRVKPIEKEVYQLKTEKEELQKQLIELEKDVHRLKIERDIYEKAAELIKKDQGINIKELTNREKAIVINALRNHYLLRELLEIMEMAKSIYCYQTAALKTDKYSKLRVQVKKIFEESHSRYGYRRIHSVVNSEGICVSEKVIRRIMKEEDLAVPYTKKKKYNSYRGDVGKGAENVINRDFHTDIPNAKWLTDITEFHIPAGKVYLSPIIDCFDGMPVSWTIGTSPDARLANAMLDKAIFSLKGDEHPIIHSDQGIHYRWPGWIQRVEEAGLTRSMSKKGCCPDNAACEGFFGRLKNEMFYGKSWVGFTIDEFIEILDEYIKWYGEKRIKLSLGGLSPLDYRISLGLVV